MFDDPFKRQQSIQSIQNLEKVAADLRDILEGSRPTRAELLAAPILRDYGFIAQPVPVALGHCIGHPVLRDGHVTTSQVYMIDPELRWIRTLSRFYRLEAPLLPPGAGRAPRRHS